MYLNDPWSLSSLRTLDEDPIHTKMKMSLSTVEVAYQVVLDLVVDPSLSSSWTKEEDLSAQNSWKVVS